MTVVSSAKRMNFNKDDEFTISFIYIKKSNGPKIDPCGTPYFRGNAREHTELIQVNLMEKLLSAVKY